jgi:cobalt/nickel transport system permease protein
MGPRANGTRATLAIVAGSVLSLQLGAMAVVLQTVASGISALPLATFAWFMLPIHLAIGLVEGLASAAVVSFVHRMRPDILREAGAHPRPIRGVLAAFAAVALAVGGVAAWYASDAPDGLEWSIERVAGTAGPPAPDGALHAGLERLQRRLAFLPDYAFARHGEQADGTAPAPPAEPAAVADATPTSRLETSVAGIVGATLAMALAALLGLAAAALARRR